MSTTVSNKYKNIIKKLRKNNTSANYIGNRKKDNYFKFLKDEEYDEVNDEVNDEQDKNILNQLESKVSREKYKIVFNDLPEDTINIILEYLPYQTRIAIFKHKYNTKFIKKTLTKIPETTEDLKKMWNCAKIARDLLFELIDDNSNIASHLAKSSIECFLQEKQIDKYSYYYKKNFTGIIMALMKNYSKIYKGIKRQYSTIHYHLVGNTYIAMYNYYSATQHYDKKVIEHIEKIILNIFAHFELMKK